MLIRISIVLLLSFAFASDILYGLVALILFVLLLFILPMIKEKHKQTQKANEEHLKNKEQDTKDNEQQLKDDELNQEVLDLRKEAFNLRFQRASGQLENTARVRQVRRDIARLKTVLHQRRASA